MTSYAFQFPIVDSNASPSTSIIVAPGGPDRSSRYKSDQGPLPSPSVLMESFSTPRPAPTPPTVNGSMAAKKHVKSASEGALLSSQTLQSLQGTKLPSNEKPWTYRRPGALSEDATKFSQDEATPSSNRKSPGSRSDRSLTVKMPIIQPRDESLGCLARQQRRREKGKEKASERRDRSKEKSLPATPSSSVQQGSSHVQDAFRSEAMFRPNANSALPRTLRRPMLPAAYMHQSPVRMFETSRHRSRDESGADPGNPLIGFADISGSGVLASGTPLAFSRPLLPSRASSQQSHYREHDGQMGDHTPSPSSRRSLLMSDEQDGRSTAQSSVETREPEIDMMFAAADHCRKRQGGSRNHISDFMSPVLEQRESTDTRQSGDTSGLARISLQTRQSFSVHRSDLTNGLMLSPGPVRKHGHSQSVDLLRNANADEQRVHFATNPSVSAATQAGMQRSASSPGQSAGYPASNVRPKVAGPSDDLHNDSSSNNGNYTNRIGGGSLSAGFIRRGATWSRGQKSSSSAKSVSENASAAQLTFSNPWVLSPKQVARAEAAAAAAALQRDRAGFSAPIGKDRWQNLWTATKGLASRPKGLGTAGFTKSRNNDGSESDDELFGSTADYTSRRTSEQGSFSAPFGTQAYRHDGAPVPPARRTTEPLVRPLLIIPESDSGPASPRSVPRTPPTRKAVPSPALTSLTFPLPAVAAKASPSQNLRRFDIEPDSPVVPAIWRNDDGSDGTPQPSPAIYSSNLFEKIDEDETEQQHVASKSKDPVEGVIFVTESRLPVSEKDVGALKAVHLVTTSPQVQAGQPQSSVSMVAALSDDDKSEEDFFETGSGAAEEELVDQNSSAGEIEDTFDVASLLAAHKHKRNESALSNHPQSTIDGPRQDDQEPSFLEQFVGSEHASSDDSGDVTPHPHDSPESEEGGDVWLRAPSQTSEACNHIRVMSIASLLKLGDKDAVIDEEESSEGYQHDDAKSWDGDILFRPSPNPSHSDHKSAFRIRMASSSDGGHEVEAGRTASSLALHSYRFSSHSSPGSELSHTDRFRFPRPPGGKPFTASSVMMRRQKSDQENAPLSSSVAEAHQDDGEKGDFVEDIKVHASNPSVSSQSSNATHLSHFGFSSVLSTDSSRNVARRVSTSSLSPSKRTSLSTPLSTVVGMGGKRLSNSYIKEPSWTSPRRQSTPLSGNEDNISRTILSPVPNGAGNLPFNTHAAGPPLSSYVRHRPTFSNDSSSSQATGLSDYSSNLLHTDSPQRQSKEQTAAATATAEVAIDGEDKDMAEGGNSDGETGLLTANGASGSQAVGHRRLKDSIDMLEKAAMSRIDESEGNAGVTGLGLTATSSRDDDTVGAEAKSWDGGD